MLRHQAPATESAKLRLSQACIGMQREDDSGTRHRSVQPGGTGFRRLEIKKKTCQCMRRGARDNGTCSEFNLRLSAAHTVSPSKILLGHSLESDLYTVTIIPPMVHRHALVFHHSRSRLPKRRPAWLTRKWLGHTLEDRGPSGQDAQAT